MAISLSQFRDKQVPILLQSEQAKHNVVLSSGYQTQNLHLNPELSKAIKEIRLNSSIHDDTFTDLDKLVGIISEYIGGSTDLAMYNHIGERLTVIHTDLYNKGEIFQKLTPHINALIDAVENFYSKALTASRNTVEQPEIMVNTGLKEDTIKDTPFKYSKPFYDQSTKKWVMKKTPVSHDVSESVKVTNTKDIVKHHLVNPEGGRASGTGTYSSFYHAQRAAEKHPKNVDIVPVEFNSRKEYVDHMIKHDVSESLDEGIADYHTQFETHKGTTKDYHSSEGLALEFAKHHAKKLNTTVLVKNANGDILHRVTKDKSVQESLDEALSGRGHAERGYMHPSMAATMDPKDSQREHDFYEPKTGDKISGKVVKNSEGEVHMKVTEHPYDKTQIGKIHKFKVGTLDEAANHYYEGTIAAVKGIKYSENPHPKGSEEHLDWCKGHNSMRAQKLQTEAVKTSDIPAYLRKARNDAPLTVKDVKAPSKDSLSAKENLEKARGVEESEDLYKEMDKKKAFKKKPQGGDVQGSPEKSDEIKEAISFLSFINRKS